MKRPNNEKRLANIKYLNKDYNACDYGKPIVRDLEISVCSVRNLIPKVIIDMVIELDGWLSGSSLYKVNPQDYDIIVPVNNWPQTVQFTQGREVTLTYFNGIHFIYHDYIIEMLVVDILEFLKRMPVHNLYHPGSDALYVKRS